MKIAGYELDLLVVGFPVCHGGMGWSTIVHAPGTWQRRADRYRSDGRTGAGLVAGTALGRNSGA
ncbi:MAG TPA: hypothetical protein VL522_15075 [Bordetella sp.]|nr:hypothetical protein [Bordetella sp.]